MGSYPIKLFYTSNIPIILQAMRFMHGSKSATRAVVLLLQAFCPVHLQTALVSNLYFFSQTLGCRDFVRTPPDTGLVARKRPRSGRVMTQDGTSQDALPVPRRVSLPLCPGSTGCFTSASRPDSDVRP